MAKKDKNKKGLWTEFKEFAIKGNAMALAVGTIIGAAFKTITDSDQRCDHARGKHLPGRR